MDKAPAPSVALQRLNMAPAKERVIDTLDTAKENIQETNTAFETKDEETSKRARFGEGIK